MERILLAFSSDAAGQKIRSMLEGTGCEIDGRIFHSGAELLRAAGDYDRALIIMGFKLPDMVADEIYENLHGGCKLMSIVKAEHVDDIGHDDIFTLPLPVSRQRLISSINIFLGHIPEHTEKADAGKRKSTPESSDFPVTKKARTEEETKLIERAKLLLMERYHMTEQQAHRFIQKRSMDVGAKLIDTARAILNIGSGAES